MNADISRGRHNAASQDAFLRARVTQSRDQERLLFALKLSTGLTSKELVKITEIPLQTVSGRLAEMKVAGLVRGTKVRREGAEVIEAVQKEMCA